MTSNVRLTALIAFGFAWWLIAILLALRIEAQPTFTPQGEGSPVYQAQLGGTATNIMTVPSGSRRMLTGVHFVNAAATACYVQLYDATSATPGTTSNKLHFYIPPANGLFLGTYDYAFGPAETPAFITALLAAATTTASGGTACGSSVDAQFSVR